MFKIRHTRTGWIVFIPQDYETWVTCEELVVLGYIRPMQEGYVSAEQTVFVPQTKKTRCAQVSR